MPFILIRRTNYPLEGEGSSYYFNGRKLTTQEIGHDKWVRQSKSWHLGPKLGGTFWCLFPNKWLNRPEATWEKLLVSQDTFKEYDIYARPFKWGASHEDKGWVELPPNEYSPCDFQRKDWLEFYLIRRFNGTISL